MLHLRGDRVKAEEVIRLHRRSRKLARTRQPQHEKVKDQACVDQTSVKRDLLKGIETHYIPTFESLP